MVSKYNINEYKINDLIVLIFKKYDLDKYKGSINK